MDSVDKELNEAKPDVGVPASSQRVVRQLQDVLPGCILLRSDTAAFNASASNYFAQQLRTTRPACIVHPENVTPLGQAVAILHQEFLARKKERLDDHNDLEFVSLRSGGILMPEPLRASTVACC